MFFCCQLNQFDAPRNVFLQLQNIRPTLSYGTACYFWTHFMYSIPDSSVLSINEFYVADNLIVALMTRFPIKIKRC